MTYNGIFCLKFVQVFCIVVVGGYLLNNWERRKGK